MDDLQSYVERLGRDARRASGQLATLTGNTRNAALRRIATALRAQKDALIAAHAADIDAALRQAGTP